MARGNASNNRSEDTTERVGALERAFISLGEIIRRTGSRDEGTDWLEKVARQRPPTYDGKEDPRALEGWIQRFDKLFIALNCPEHRRVDLAVYYLEDNAELWWQHYDRSPASSFGWDQLKEALRRRFYPLHLRKEKREEFANLKMGALSVHDYYAKFMELLRFAPDMAGTEEMKIAKFEAGLSLSIQEILGGHTFNYVSELYEKAANVYRVQQKRKKETERKEERHVFKKANVDNPTEQKQRQPEPNYYNQAPNQRRERRCARCGRDHPGQNCQGNPVTCYWCGHKGHRSFECQKRRDDLGKGIVNNNQVHQNTESQHEAANPRAR